jgi:hypothetical protein
MTNRWENFVIEECGRVRNVINFIPGEKFEISLEIKF